MHGQDQMASTYREGEYEKMTTARFASEIMNAIVRANRSVLKNSLPKTGFELNAGRSGEWAIVHTGNGSAVHNHKSSMDARVHAAHRSRAAQDIIATSERSVHSTIEAQSAAGVPVANIYATMLNHDPNTMLLPKDIANAKDSARRRVLASATPIEALFNQLNQEKFFYRYTTYLETQRLKYLLWAHPATASLYKFNSDILVMDCTYKANKFDLLLLNVISLTGMDTVILSVKPGFQGRRNKTTLGP
ncbi:hypothetical protein F442_05912 [Phytophthora nicotianae P10297]|uniref:MULE transposase domain-containing protein n=1 Tax=Phytophthora nicotianae P10297 TaxID=1317064 RepID=W2ZQ47_PHYNI|nr:hypothetical protein F442_05912 [Phytophthora nicotianae P10297]